MWPALKNYLGKTTCWLHEKLLQNLKYTVNLFNLLKQRLGNGSSNQKTLNLCQPFKLQKSYVNTVFERLLDRFNIVRCYECLLKTN